MRAAWCLPMLAAIAGCGDAPRAANPRVSRDEAPTTLPARSAIVSGSAEPPSSSASAAALPQVADSGAPVADAPSGDKRLPLICEAYFAKLSQCIRASVSRHPDEATKAEVQKRFEKAEQTSRALMTAAMEPKDAEAYCRQALLALTASPCE